MRTNILHCRPYCNVTLVRCKNKLTARLAATGRIVGGNPTNHTKRHAGKPQKATRLQLAEEKRNGSVQTSKIYLPLPSHQEPLYMQTTYPVRHFF